jgi:hypothetical protein
MLLELLEKEYSVYKFDKNYSIDINIFESDFVSVIRTKDEISIVAISGSMEHYEKNETGWKILKIIGILDFSLIGIISNISTILAHENIGIFALSTYNTDYFMIKEKDIEKAIKVLRKNKYEIKDEK